MPNHTSKISRALRKAGLPLRLQTKHGTVVVHPADEDGHYLVAGCDQPPERNATLDNALAIAAARLESVRPPELEDPADPFE